ncbi:MAG: hypothetical protein J0L73_19955 [Verrucomicrobia bacterium]|nr:hypothetical protein [Verrucomicrobiota bacterium]
MSVAMETPQSSSDEVPMFPPWLDLPPNYLVQDWIRWQKGKLVAARLRQQPQLLQQGTNWLLRDQETLSVHDAEWLALLQTGEVEKVARILEDSGDTGQRLRSGMPFKGAPFVTPQEMESIRERAYAG